MTNALVITNPLDPYDPENPPTTVQAARATIMVFKTAFNASPSDVLVSMAEDHFDPESTEPVFSETADQVLAWEVASAVLYIQLRTAGIDHATIVERLDQLVSVTLTEKTLDGVEGFDTNFEFFNGDGIARIQDGTVTFESEDAPVSDIPEGGEPF